MWQKKRCFRVVEKCWVVSRWLSRCASALKGLIELYFLTRNYDIFNWGEGYSAIWDYFYVQISGAALKKKNLKKSFGGSYYRCQRCSWGTLGIQQSENVQKTSLSLFSTFPNLWLYFHYSWFLVLNLGISLQTVYSSCPNDYFREIKKKKEGFFFFPLMWHM